MRSYFAVIPAVLLVAACTKTITPALNTAPAQVMIQGAVSDTAGPYYVSIVQSVGFYTENSYPGVSGAVITITDSTTGLRDSLRDLGSGLYATRKLLQGVPGNTYLLNVSLNGKVYTASSTMPRPVVLDSVTFDTSNNKQILAIANYQDPAGVVNFYKYSTVINGVPDKRFQTFEDRLSDGRYIRAEMDYDTGEIKRFDTVQLSVVGIDKGVYTFLSEAENIAYGNNNLAAPATPTSNITGGCLGYFSAQTVSSRANVVR